MISDGVMMVDRHGIIRYMNKAGFEILGVSQDAIEQTSNRDNSF